MTDAQMAIIALVQRAPAEPEVATRNQWYDANPIDSAQVDDAIRVAQAYRDACNAAVRATPEPLRSKHRGGMNFPYRDEYRREQIATLRGSGPVVTRLRHERAARYTEYVRNEWPVVWARRMYDAIIYGE